MNNPPLTRAVTPGGTQYLAVADPADPAETIRRLEHIRELAQALERHDMAEPAVQAALAELAGDEAVARLLIAARLAYHAGALERLRRRTAETPWWI